MNGDEVVDDLEARNSGEAGARDRLHGHDVDLFDAKGIVKWFEGQDEADRRTVGVGDDGTAVIRLGADQVQVIRVDLGNQQRNVVPHPVVLRVRDDEVPGGGEPSSASPATSESRADSTSGAVRSASIGRTSRPAIESGIGDAWNHRTASR